MKLETNANTLALAAILADANLGTFTGIITRLKGEVRGGETYGDDLVHCVIYTGFRYDTLLQRSLTALEQLDTDAVLADLTEAGVIGWERAPKPSDEEIKAAQDLAEAEVEALTYDSKAERRKAINAARKAAKEDLCAEWAKGKQPVKITREHVVEALAQIRESLTLSLAGENQSTTDHVFETLTVNGKQVRGVQVYTGDKAEETGTIYLNGLMIGRKVIEPAANGPVPAPQSAPVVAVKNFVEKRLPKRRYVKFALPKGGDWLLNAGGTASALSAATGVQFTPDVAEVIDRMAAA